MTYFHVLEREVGAIGHQDGSVDSDAVRVPLILLRVRIPLQVGKLEARLVGHNKFLLSLIVTSTKRDENLLRAGDHFRKLLELATDEEPSRRFAVLGGVLEPVTERSLRLPAAARAAVEDLEDGALQEGHLRPGLRLPDYVLVRGDLSGGV